MNADKPTQDDRNTQAIAYASRDNSVERQIRKVDMKITGVSSTLYQFTMSRRMGDANSPMGRARGSGCVVELHTDTELTGITTGGGAALPIIEALVEGVLIGQDPRHVTGLWQRMVNKHFKGGHDGIANDAISALDIALWDLKAKANDEPLWKTLGGVHQPINAYASGLDMPLSDQEIFDFYRSMAENYGFTDGKLKIGLDQDRDLRRIGLMNDALSINTDEPGLMVDANEYWSPKQAIRKVREMEEQFDLMWIEEPARRWDFLGLRRICDAVKTPVCAGENLDTLGDFLPLLPQPLRRHHPSRLRYDRHHLRTPTRRRRIWLQPPGNPRRFGRTPSRTPRNRHPQLHHHRDRQPRTRRRRHFPRRHIRKRQSNPRRQTRPRHRNQP